jgi:esterase/lipase superfamily enzyme
MQIEYHKWFSPILGHDMELKVYGYYGQPVLLSIPAGPLSRF